MTQWISVSAHLLLFVLLGLYDGQSKGGFTRLQKFASFEKLQIFAAFFEKVNG